MSSRNGINFQMAIVLSVFIHRYRIVCDAEIFFFFLQVQDTTTNRILVLMEFERISYYFCAVFSNFIQKL